MIMDAQMFCHTAFKFLIKHITSSTHKEDSVKILSSLNIYLHDIQLLAPLIIQRTFFCKLKLSLLSLAISH
jgi:hypothetical protein